MIFYLSSMNGVPEFRAFVPKLDKNTEWEQLFPDIENAEYELGRIVGKNVLALARDAHETADQTNIPEQNSTIVKLVQAAIANMAFMSYTVTNDLRHSASGRKSSINPANEKQAWEFLIDKDNEGLTFRVQKSINRLIGYLDENKVEEWTKSAAFLLKHSVILSDIELFTRYYPIEDSLLLFNQLLPIQKEMQRKHIAPLLGKKLLSKLLKFNSMEGDPVDPVQLEESGTGDYSVGTGSNFLTFDDAEPLPILTTEENLGILMDYAGPALALWTMATGIKRLSVKLLPEGLVQQFKSSVQSRNSSFNVDQKEKDMIIVALMRDAEEATNALETQVKIMVSAATKVAVAPTIMLGERNLEANKYFSA